MKYNVRYSTGYLYEGKDMDYAYSIPLGIMIGGGAVVFSVKNEGENDLTLTGSPFVDLTGDDVFSIAAQPVGYAVKLSPDSGVRPHLPNQPRHWGWACQTSRNFSTVCKTRMEITFWLDNPTPPQAATPNRKPSRSMSPMQPALTEWKTGIL
ncbi:MAG: hypothetical protein LBK73_12725 [Treponema sp.]|jgi:hypothetical protein|nr:hypothetical protein [Treponema sp.]